MSKKTSDDIVREQQETSEESMEAESVANDEINDSEPVDETSSQEKETESEEISAEDESAKLAEMNDRYIRLMAEFDNFKRRTSREYQRMVEAANERLMVELLPVRDNFERALKAKDTNASQEALHQGMEMIFTKLDETLRNSGLEPFGQAGDQFDPQIHDALMNTPSEDIPEGHVADLFERGYKLKGKVIRHAKVIVSSGKPQDAQKE